MPLRTSVASLAVAAVSATTGSWIGRRSARRGSDRMSWTKMPLVSRYRMSFWVTLFSAMSAVVMSWIGISHRE